MASPRKSGEPARPEATVSRTYRAAIRIGEDYVTLEETIVLPLDASDEEVAKAVDLGWRIYRQRPRSATPTLPRATVNGTTSPPSRKTSPGRTSNWHPTPRNTTLIWSR
jgi:hypothetical protein